MSKDLETITWVDLEKAFNNAQPQVMAMLAQLVDKEGRNPIWEKAVEVLREDWANGRVHEGCVEAVKAGGSPDFDMGVAMAHTIVNTFYYCLSMATGIGDIPDAIREALGDELADAMMNKLRSEAYSHMFP